MAGGAAIALVGAAWVGNQLAGDARDSKLGKNFANQLAVDREVSLRREINLWTQVGDERRARIELIGTFQRIDTLSVEARSKLIDAMAQERRTSEAALAQAQQNIQELKNAASEAAENWKRGAIPADIVCGVFNGKGCPGPTDPAAGSDRDDGLAVRDGAPDANAGAAIRLP